MLKHRTAGVFLACYLCFSLGLASPTIERFEEELILRPLRDGKIASKFSFATTLEGATPRNPTSLGYDDDFQHYTVFPLALGQVLREYAVTELHLSLNAGKWNYDRWGYPDEPGVGSGAELWAWMGDGAPATVDERWRGLRNALAGLFCASLGSLDDQRTTSPVLTFAPEGSLPNWSLPHQLRHASLPSEQVCTENLTPFLKLLPCKSLSGIASLLNPHRIFDADWHGMGIHVLWHEDEGVQIRLTFQAVLDPVRLSSNDKRDWSFRSIFDRVIDSACPVAHSSSVKVMLPKNEAYSLNPDPSATKDGMAVFDISPRLDAINIEMQWPMESNFQYPLTLHETPLTDLSVQRTLRGFSQDRGQLSVVITNNMVSSIPVIYLETMPWLLQFYLHTLQTRCNGIVRDDLISDISYTPPVPHSRPTMLQSVVTLPPNASVHLTIDVTKSFLRYTEHPPDAQRGWDLPPAVFVPLDASDNQTILDNRLRGISSAPSQRIYTPVLLVDLATPDFSMPYNVIIMSCSLMAMIFGSVFNLLTRRFVIVYLERGEQRSSQ